MDLSSISGINTNFHTPTISSRLDNSLGDQQEENGVFHSLLDSAVQMIRDANDYSNAAEEEEIKFSLGETDSIHDLMIAQQKANVSLQYTVAVRDAFIQGYREIMNLQF